MDRDQHGGDVDTQAWFAQATKQSAHYLIGLTGNIATGKSAVMDILRKLGAYVIDADKVAHQVMASQRQVKEAIVRAFGDDILTSQGEIDRSKLGPIVFKDAQALRQLERIVHPAVIQAVDELIEQAAEDVVVIEAIKLIESGMHRNYDAVWVVTSPVEQQANRLVTQRGLTEKEAMLRIEAQPRQADKLAQADVVIDNSGSLQDLKRQVTTEWLKIAHQLFYICKGGEGVMNRKVVVRRARRKDIEAIVGIVNGSGWRARPIGQTEAADMLLRKGCLLAISRNGAGIAGWQTENLVNCVDDFYVYPAREAEALVAPMLSEVEAAAKELECEISTVMVPPRGRAVVEPLLAQSGYEQRALIELDKIWTDVLKPFLAEGQSKVWVKRLREDRVTMPI